METNIPNSLAIIMLTVAVNSKNIIELEKAAKKCKLATDEILANNSFNENGDKFRSLMVMQACAMQNMGKFDEAMKIIEELSRLHEKTWGGVFSVNGAKGVYVFCMAASMLNKKEMQSEDILKKFESHILIDEEVSNSRKAQMLGCLAMAYFSMRDVNPKYMPKAIQAIESAITFDKNQLEKEKLNHMPIIKNNLAEEWFSFIDGLEVSMKNSHENENKSVFKRMFKR